MPKKWIRGGINPEGTRFLIEVNVPKLKKTKSGVPGPPPNFLPPKPKDIGIPGWLEREK